MNDTRLEIRIDSATLETLRRLAAADERSVSDYLRRLIRSAASQAGD